MSVLGAAPGLVVMAASTITLDFGWLGVLGGFTAAVVGAIAVYRKIEPERRKLQAEADRLIKEGDEIEARISKTVLENVERDMQRAREATAHAQAETAEAVAEAARQTAKHMREFEAWKEERHDLINQLKDAEIEKERVAKERLAERHEFETRIKALEDRIDVLNIRLGYERGRRDDDVAATATQDARLTELEARADTSEAKATTAKGVADTQRDRNDDTPGHA